MAEKMSMENTLTPAQFLTLLFAGEHDGTSVAEPEVNSTTTDIL